MIAHGINENEKGKKILYKHFVYSEAKEIKKISFTSFTS